MQGRTEGEPCLGLLDLCDDFDVDAWLHAAKTWTTHAQKFREAVRQQWGSDPQFWPPKAQSGELAYKGARDLLGGDQGWLDGSKVGTLIQAQRYAKTALEFWFQALEEALGVTLDPGALGDDGLTDPQN